MRSMPLSGKCSSAAKLKFKLFMGRPSTNTKACLDSAPRMNKVATPPMPPDWVISIPASCCSKLGTSLACERSMSERVMTETSGKASCARCITRLAVITVSGKNVWEKARAGMAMQDTSALKRNAENFMIQPTNVFSPPSPTVHER